LDSVPKYNHAVDYLDIDRRLIRNTIIKLRDSQTTATLTITETFWNEGKNRIIERTDTGPGGEYWEVIVDTQAQDQSPIVEILRFGRQDGLITPWYHGFIARNQDGSETETKVYPKEEG